MRAAAVKSMTLLFKIIDHLPVPPQEIINGIDLTLKPVINEYGMNNQRYLKNWNVKNPKAGVNRRIKYPLFDEWVKNNITKDFNDVGINYVYIEDGPASTGAHTDGTRNFVLLYPILQGGSDAKLTYWQEEGYDILRPWKTQGEDLSKLHKLSEIKLPNNAWVLNHTNVLHSVENLYSTRINLQISLNENPWE